MPRRRWRQHRLLRHGVHDRLRGSALRPEVDEAGEEYARVEEHVLLDYGHRFRSSSTSAATSSAGRASAPTVGRATSRRPTFISRGPGGHALEANAEFLDGHLEHRPWREACPLTDRRRNYHSACLVNGCSHATIMPSAMVSAGLSGRTSPD